jgi:putative oxidoreductase
MFVAAVSAHLPKGFWAHLGGYEYTLVFGASALTLAFTGPGAFSIDNYLGLELSGTSWGLAALIVGLVGGSWPLLSRRTPELKAQPNP